MNSNSVNNEHIQLLTLSSIVKDKSLFLAVYRDITVKYFTDNEYQFIYKLVYNYFNSYDNVPIRTEVKSMVETHYNESYGDKKSIISKVDQVYDSELGDAGYIKESITNFIRTNKIDEILVSVVEQIQRGTEYDRNKVADQFAEALSFDITQEEIRSLSSFEDYLTARRNVLGDGENPTIIRSTIGSINESLQFGGYKYGDLVAYVAAPGVGKTSFMINEGKTALMTGYKVLHFFVGDMSEFSVMNRYMSSITGVEMKELTRNPAKYNELLDHDPILKQMNVLKNLDIVVKAPGEITTSQLASIVDQLQVRKGVHYDMIIIDYPDNLVAESTMMYESGGAIYNQLKGLAMNNKSVVMIASQPKISEYSKEVIAFEGIAESSKKLHVVDVLITIGKKARGLKVATLFIAKSRDGIDGGIVRMNLDWHKCQCKEITHDEYQSIVVAYEEENGKIDPPRYG